MSQLLLSGHIISSRKKILAKVKSKYWTRTHKIGIQIPKNIKEAKLLDDANGNTLWWDAIMLEIDNVRIAFDEFDGKIENIPPGFQKIKCHLIFDIKLSM